jgi:hypothetical protein
MMINYSSLFEQIKIWILEYKNFEQIINTETLLTTSICDVSSQTS